MELRQIEHYQNKSFIDGEILSNGDSLLVDQKKRFYRNGQEVVIQGEYSDEFPLVRSLSDKRFLLVDGEVVDEDRDNAWIIRNNGIIEGAFKLGAAIKLEVTNCKIIVSYCKSSLDTDRLNMTKIYVNCSPNNSYIPYKSLSTNGLAVFDLNGNCLFKYYKETSDSNLIAFMENYASVKKDGNTIYLLLYLFDSGYTLAKFSLENYIIDIVFNIKNALDALGNVYSPIAITKKDDDWFFYMISCDSKKNRTSGAIFKWNKEDSFDKVCECNFSIRAKGIWNKGFSIPNTLPQNKHSSYFIYV